jgi:hypothetical protein
MTLPFTPDEFFDVLAAYKVQTGYIGNTLNREHG